MKKLVGLVLLMVALGCYVFGQDFTVTDIAVSPLIAGPTEVQVRSQLFDISCQGGGFAAETLLRELELRFDVYNKLFIFNTADIKKPLKVRAFIDKTAYDNYVSAKLGSTWEGAVYLHYNDVNKRELIINLGSAEAERIMPHQAFIQYLRAFIPYPPTWMREGFAIYFNTLKFNRETRELVYEENLAWLDTVKRMAAENREPSLQSVFLADVNNQTPEYFHPMSWALVSFLLNVGGGGNYFRSLTESFILLDPNATAAENDKIVLNRLTSWTTLEKMHEDYRAYISTRKTFAELIIAGQQSYAVSDYIGAEANFMEALWQKPNHYAAYYYLGLIAYTNNRYDMAEQYYNSALQFLAINHSADDEALIQYALGVNAASAGKTDNALIYLNNAATLSPERYRARADEIIKKLAPNLSATDY
jgi:tetratricopeptide (TPR) repeat protein